MHGNIFCKCPDASLPRTCVDLVTGLELPDIGTNPDHDACDIVAQYQGKAVRQDQLELSVPDLVVQGVHAGGMNLNHDVVLTQVRLGTFAEPQSAAFRIAIDQE